MSKILCILTLTKCPPPSSPSETPSRTGNICLIIDDCWERGDTSRRAIVYVEQRGYQREDIFLFHFLGSGSVSGLMSERYGFVFQNPVLVSATTMLDFFDNPKKYQ